MYYEFQGNRLSVQYNARFKITEFEIEGFYRKQALNTSAQYNIKDAIITDSCEFASVRFDSRTLCIIIWNIRICSNFMRKSLE